MITHENIMAKTRLSRAEILELHRKSKFSMTLTDVEKKEFEYLAEGLYRDINENRRKSAELPLYETDVTVPTRADLEFARELDHELFH